MSKCSICGANSGGWCRCGDKSQRAGSAVVTTKDGRKRTFRNIPRADEYHYQQEKLGNDPQWKRIE